MLILVKMPFTEFVPGEGMVVGNMGRIVSLPDKMAQSRIDSSFGEESTQEAFDEQEAADAAAAEVIEGILMEMDGEPGEGIQLNSDGTAPVAKPRGKRGPNKPKAKAVTASPVTAPTA